MDLLVLALFLAPALPDALWTPSRFGRRPPPSATRAGENTTSSSSAGLPTRSRRRALEFYLALSQNFRVGDYHEPGVFPIFTSDLIYTATIARWDEFELGDLTFHDVYVPDVELSWMYDDGTFWPYVAASRTVILSPLGDLLAIDGDGKEHG
jgi:hypothetical protein